MSLHQTSLLRTRAPAHTRTDLGPKCAHLALYILRLVIQLHSTNVPSPLRCVSSVVRPRGAQNTTHAIAQAAPHAFAIATAASASDVVDVLKMTLDATPVVALSLPPQPGVGVPCSVSLRL